MTTENATEHLLLPADLEQYEAMREAEETEPIPLMLPTLADAQRALARVRYFRQKATEVDMVFTIEITRLQEELRHMQTAMADAIRPWRRREQWYADALEQHARATNALDPKIKSVKLPAGELTLRAQQPEWQYTDEETLLAAIKADAPELVRVREEINKVDLKKVAQIRTDGQVVLKDTGAILPGVKVQPRPAAFTIKTGV